MRAAMQSSGNPALGYSCWRRFGGCSSDDDASAAALSRSAQRRRASRVILGQEFIMNARTENVGNHSFLIGLLAGGVIGAGLAIAFAPRLASGLRQRVTTPATDLSHAASPGYQKVSTRIAGVVG